MNSWREQLAVLSADAAGRLPDPPTWDDTTRRTNEITTTVLALDGIGITLDMLHDMEIDELRDGVTAAFAHFSPGRYGEAFDLSVLGTFEPQKLQSLLHTVKGFALELEVRDAILAGAIDWPDGAATFELAPPGTPAVDGYFLDAHGAIVEEVQIKATTGAGYLASTLNKHPDIPIYTNSEAAELATERGLEVVDTGIELSGIFPTEVEALVDTLTTSPAEVLDEVVPQLALALAGASIAVAYFTGADVEAAKQRAVKRAGRATVISSAGAALSVITGLEYARLLVAGTVTAVGIAERVVGSNVSPTVGRLQAYQGVLETLAAPSPAPAAGG